MVDRSLNTQTADVSEAVDTELSAAIVAVMDELHDRAYRGQPLTAELVGAMNEHQKAMVQRYGMPSRDRMREEM